MKKDKKIVLVRGRLHFDNIYMYILWRLHQSSTQHKKKNKVKDCSGWSAGFTADEITDIIVDDEVGDKPKIYVITPMFTLDVLNPRETEETIKWVEHKIVLQKLEELKKTNHK